MRIDIKKLTEVMARVSAMTIGDKNIPMIMLDTTETKETQKAKICFYDGHKAYTETFDVVTDETDLVFKKMVVTLDSMQGIVNKCQSTGDIKIDEIVLSVDDSFIHITAEQYMIMQDAEGNEIGTRHLGLKEMEIGWFEVEKDIKTKLVDRMDYSGIFDDTIIADEYVAADLSSALKKTSTESSKTTYIGKQTQSIFVYTSIYAVLIPIDGYEVTLEDKDAIRGELLTNGTYTDEAFEKAIAEKANRVHFSAKIAGNMCKTLTTIIDKSGAEKVNIFNKDGNYCCVNIDTDNDNRIGVWFEMPQGAKTDLGGVERFNALAYETYQLDIITSLFASTIRSAKLDLSGNYDNIILKVNKLEDATYELEIKPSAANKGNKYKMTLDRVVDTSQNISEREYTISLKVFEEMLSHIDTPIVTMDFQVQPDGGTCVRLGELDVNKMSKEYGLMRSETETLCTQNGEQFNADTTPTADSVRIAHRRATLGTQQFTTIAK